MISSNISVEDIDLSVDKNGVPIVIGCFIYIHDTILETERLFKVMKNSEGDIKYFSIGVDGERTGRSVYRKEVADNDCLVVEVVKNSQGLIL